MAFTAVMGVLAVSIVRVWQLGDQLGAAERETVRLQVGPMCARAYMVGCMSA